MLSLRTSPRATADYHINVHDILFHFIYFSIVYTLVYTLSVGVAVATQLIYTPCIAYSSYYTLQSGGAAGFV